MERQHLGVVLEVTITRYTPKPSRYNHCRQENVNPSLETRTLDFFVDAINLAKFF